MRFDYTYWEEDKAAQAWLEEQFFPCPTCNRDVQLRDCFDCTEFGVFCSFECYHIKMKEVELDE